MIQVATSQASKQFTHNQEIQNQDQKSIKNKSQQSIQTFIEKKFDQIVANQSQIHFGEDIFFVEVPKNQEEEKQKLEKYYEEQIKTLKQKYENQIQQQSYLISQLMDHIKHLEAEKESAQITTSQQSKFSKIINFQELDLFNQWLTQDKLKIHLQPIYRATEEGFQIEKVYNKCSNKKNLIFVLQTEQNYRFGFFTNLEIQDNKYQFIYQNPNKIFLFSLDLKKKFLSNFIGCEHAFYSNKNYFSVGLNDLVIYSDSNNSIQSCNHFGCYGAKQGIVSPGSLNGGFRNFKTVEIEIFQVNYQ